MFQEKPSQTCQTCLKRILVIYVCLHLSSTPVVHKQLPTDCAYTEDTVVQYWAQSKSHIVWAIWFECIVSVYWVYSLMSLADMLMPGLNSITDVFSVDHLM